MGLYYLLVTRLRSGWLDRLLLWNVVDVILFYIYRLSKCKLRVRSKTDLCVLNVYVQCG